MTGLSDIKTLTKPRLAFVGTGWIGLTRIKSLLEHDICEPVGISDTWAENEQKALEICPDAKIYRTIDDVIESKPDGIVIATPSALHYEQSMSALSNGIPVFCQKPLSRTAAESKEIIDQARDADRLLGVDMSYRFTDGMQKIYGLAATHELGNIYSADLVFHNAYGPDKEWFYNPKLSGGGCLIDLGIHLVDLAFWIMNFPEVKCIHSSLFARGNRIKNPEEVSEDFVSAQLETTNGKTIRITCSWNLPAGKNAEIKAAFYGTDASAVFSNVNGSFYDFETCLCHGTTNTVISSPPDDWGGRALIDWTKKLQQSNRFDESVSSYEKVAEVIDSIYGREY